MVVLDIEQILDLTHKYKLRMNIYAIQTSKVMAICESKTTNSSL